MSSWKQVRSQEKREKDDEERERRVDQGEPWKKIVKGSREK